MGWDCREEGLSGIGMSWGGYVWDGFFAGGGFVWDGFVVGWDEVKMRNAEN